MRRTVQDCLGASAVYNDDLSTNVPVVVTHRDRNAEQGDLGGDYVKVLEGVDRLKFVNPPALKRGGLVTIPGDGVFELDQVEPPQGNTDAVYWQVVRHAA